MNVAPPAIPTRVLSYASPGIRPKLGLDLKLACVALALATVLWGYSTIFFSASPMLTLQSWRIMMLVGPIFICDLIGIRLPLGVRTPARWRRGRNALLVSMSLGLGISLEAWRQMRVEEVTDWAAWILSLIGGCIVFWTPLATLAALARRTNAELFGIDDNQTQSTATGVLIAATVWMLGAAAYAVYVIWGGP